MECLTKINLKLLVLVLLGTCVNTTRWPWTQAHIGYTGSMGQKSKINGLNLSTVVMHGNEIFLENEWDWDQEGAPHRTPQLRAKQGKEIKVGCRMINGTSYKKASQITVRDIYNGPSRMSVICSNQNQERECWHNFTLTQPMFVICLWADKRAGKNQTALSFKFKLEITTTKQNPTPTKEGPLANSEKEITLTPQITRIGPYVIKRVGQQRLLFNSSWSLKRVELSMQINISAVKPACSPFITMSYTGWLAWLHGQSLTLPNRVKRNVTEILGTGLGVLNSIDMKYLQTNLVQPHMIKKKN